MPAPEPVVGNAQCATFYGEAGWSCVHTYVKDDFGTYSHAWVCAYAKDGAACITLVCAGIVDGAPCQFFAAGGSPEGSFMVYTCVRTTPEGVCLLVADEDLVCW